MSASVPSPEIDQILLELTQPIGREDPVPALRHLAREQMTYSCDCAVRRRGRPSNCGHRHHRSRLEPLVCRPNQASGAGDWISGGSISVAVES